MKSLSICALLALSLWQFTPVPISYFFMPDPIAPLPADFYIREMRQGGRSILNTGVVLLHLRLNPLK